MLTVSVTTLRTGALALVAAAAAGGGAGRPAGGALHWARRGKGTGAGLTCMGTGAGTGAGGGVLGLFREGAGFASGAGTTLLMTLSTKEREVKPERGVKPERYRDATAKPLGASRSKRRLQSPAVAADSRFKGFTRLLLHVPGPGGGAAGAGLPGREAEAPAPFLVVVPASHETRTTACLFINTGLLSWARGRRARRRQESPAQTPPARGPGSVI